MIADLCHRLLFKSKNDKNRIFDLDELRCFIIKEAELEDSVDVGFVLTARKWTPLKQLIDCYGLFINCRNNKDADKLHYYFKENRIDKIYYLISDGRNKYMIYKRDDYNVK